MIRSLIGNLCSLALPFLSFSCSVRVHPFWLMTLWRNSTLPSPPACLPFSRGASIRLHIQAHSSAHRRQEWGRGVSLALPRSIRKRAATGKGKAKNESRGFSMLPLPHSLCLSLSLSLSRFPFLFVLPPIWIYFVGCRPQFLAPSPFSFSSLWTPATRASSFSTSLGCVFICSKTCPSSLTAIFIQSPLFFILLFFVDSLVLWKASSHSSPQVEKHRKFRIPVLI